MIPDLSILMDLGERLSTPYFEALLKKNHEE